MKKLVDGDRWTDRWWSKTFDSDMALVACWLWDKADKAGFVSLDMEELAEEAFLSLPKATEAYRRLLKPYKGYARLYEREGDSSEKKWVWLRNYLKVQIGGMNFKQPEHGKQPGGVMKGIARILASKEALFPEVKAYEGYASLLKPTEGYGRLYTTLQDKTLYNNKMGECEREEAHPDYVATHEDLLYEKMLKAHLKVPWIRWAEYRKSYPDADTDWEKLVKYVIDCHVGSNTGGVSNPLMLVQKMLEVGKFMTAKGKEGIGGTTAAKKKEGMQKRSDLNEKYMSGDLDDDEVRRLHAENDAEYGL